MRDSSVDVSTSSVFALQVVTVSKNPRVQRFGPSSGMVLN